MSDEAETEKKKKGDSKVQIHTRISSESFETINNLAEVLGSKAKVIEESVEFYKKYKKNWTPEQQIWNRARIELNMFLVGKTTFMSYISGNSEKAWKNNIATEVIEWITGKNIEKLSLEEILNAIKDMWMSANYFNQIKIINVSKERYKMIFNHHILERKYSEFWANYFKTWLENNRKCNTEILIRNESFTIIIKGS